MGDFNFPNINWEDLTTKDNSDEQRFVDCLLDNYLFQLINKPTRWRGSDNPNILDLVITNDEQSISNIEYQSPLGKSDHCIITFDIDCNVLIKSKQKEKRCYHKANYSKMKEEIQDLNWERYLKVDNNDIDDMWKRFHVKLLDLEDKYVPKLKIKNKKKTEVPIDKETQNAVKEKNRLSRKFIRTKNQEDRKSYNRARNKVTKLVRKTRKQYERNIAKEAKANPKRIWKYINSKSKTRSGIGELCKDPLDKKSERTDDDSEKANILADFFSSVYTTETDDTIPNLPKRSVDTEWTPTEIKPEEVEKTLMNLKPDKSPGPDKLNPRLLKELAKEIAKPLTSIFNKSLEEKHIPSEWKKANVSPIYKKGDKKLAGNYRPVSLTSVVNKTMEKCIRNQITEHMIKNDLFTEKQYGFMSGRSTALQLLKVIDEWTEALENGDSVDCIYMDFQKAFDKVPHKRLIKKLDSYGIGTDMIEWGQNYLAGRKQQVTVNGQESSWHEVTSGIPQGSVLGPLLFIIYINDLPENLTSTVYLFADDTKIFNVIRNKEDQKSLQKDLQEIEKWTDKWLLKLHPEKCKSMHIGKNSPDMNIKYNLMGHELEKVNEEKDIGVIVDSNLNFEKHICEKIKKANSMSAKIRRIFQHLDEETFIPLYKALVRTHLDYASTVWAPYKVRLVEMIEGVQRRATKQIPSLRQLSYSERLQKLKLPTLSYRRIRGDMIEVYKITTGKYDPKIGGLLKMRNDQTNRTTTRGNTKKIYTQRARLDVRKYSFSVRTAQVWNSLPENVISAKTLNSFKNRLDGFWKNQDIVYDYRAHLNVRTGTNMNLNLNESSIEDPSPEPALENHDK